MPKISITSDIKNIPPAIEFVNAFLKENNLDFAKKADVVFDEILSNIAKYSYKDDSGEIEVFCDYDSSTKTISFKFIDSGIEFNPLAVAEADTSASVNDRPIGGLGIFIVRNLMDEVSYQRVSGKNILTLKKIFNL